jgi:predicted O-methyltransferase YrrM
MTSVRTALRNLIIGAGYIHPVVVSVALRRGPGAAKKYLAEMYRSSRVDAGAHLPCVPVEELFPQAASFQVFRPKDLTGTMSAAETATLCQIISATNPKKVVEIGTFRGVTTLNIALNAPEAEIHTLDLPPGHDPSATVYENADPEVIQKRGELVFQGTPQETRIHRHLGDSARYDYSRIGPGVDLALIDAAHSYEYVRSDTAAVLPLMKPDGILLWHDYACRDLLEAPDLRWGVSKFLHESADLGIVVLKSTTIGFLRLDSAKLQRLMQRITTSNAAGRNGA